MSTSQQDRAERRARDRRLTRASILDAARRVASSAGARNLSLRSVAAEAGFAPAALYGYFDNKDDLLLALAAEDLSVVARAMRNASHEAGGAGRLAAAAGVALSLLQGAETIAAASSALPQISGSSESERVFNGKLIAVLTALADAAGGKNESREAQSDIVVLAAALTGLAVMGRAGRLDALGFSHAELIARIEARFAKPI